MSIVYRLTSFLKTRPVFFLLLPFFFLLHAFTLHYDAVPVKAAIFRWLIYTAVAFVLYLVGRWIFRHSWKAAVFSLLLTGFECFFGPIRDTIIQIAGNRGIAQYRFLLPGCFLLILLLLIVLKRSRHTGQRLSLYLNILFMLLILVDFRRLGFKIKNEGSPSLPNGNLVFRVCDSCQKADIYLLLMDQYPSHKALKDVFGFDNSRFENELSQRGFAIIPGSHSNYNLTPFSMASLLNMDYLGPGMGRKGNLDISYSYRQIRDNAVNRFLEKEGYEFYNLSMFDFPGQPAQHYEDFFPYGIELVSAQTLSGRLTRDLKADISAGRIRMPALQKKLVSRYLRYNEQILEKTKKIVAIKENAPRFVYAHFMMPHWPYYFDSAGNEMPIRKLSAFHHTSPGDFTSYLQYCNRRILELVDYLIRGSANPPIILLLSDHGFRHPELKAADIYDFMNLNAVYYPRKNYEQIPANISNVNQFRVVFNSCFGQQFPLLKDSTIDLWD